MFEDARREAVALTDQYHDLNHDHPQRAALWDRAMRETESARQLLEAWLQSEHESEAGSKRELALV